jgi:hypothetical protein
MVAMVATMVIAGAIFKLMTAGNSAFRREPELSDRQQNIRMAMDVIAQDIYRAGHGVPQFAQAFTDGLDGVGPAGPGGVNADELEIFAATECPALSVCDSPGVNVMTFDPLNSCFDFPALVILACETDCGSGNPVPDWGLFWAEAPGGAGTSNCGTPGANNGHVNLPKGQKPLVNPAGGPNFDPEWMIVGQAIRYRVNIDAQGTPNLERSAFGGEDRDGVSTWQVIGRGVEDLQVEYLKGTVWDDEPGVITCGTNCNPPDQTALDSLVQRVRVRLSARAAAGNLQGQTTSAVGNAVRGQLVTEIAPRPATTTLAGWRDEI